MELINDSDKQKVIDFIKINDLDYLISESDIFKFKIVANDGIVFYFNNYNEEYIIVKHDPSKTKVTDTIYEYFNFKTLSLALEQLKYYDDNLPKSYWEPTTNSIEIGFDKNSYEDGWFNDFQREAEYSKSENNEAGYDYFIYDNPNYQPLIKSPFNTLHEVSTINSKEQAYVKVNKLYFEVHPVSLQESNERYFLKLLANNEKVLKEYINYKIVKKKGLKLFLEGLFKSVKKK